MNRIQFQFLNPACRPLAAAFATGLVLTTGCANMVTTATDTPLATSAATITGKVHGGNQPVAFATVSLYAIGQSGVGSAATLLATTTTANNGAGSFSFTQLSGTGTNSGTTSSYYCPAASSNPLLYLVAKGGNTQGNGINNSSNLNSAAAFMAPVGPCSTAASVDVDITEVTTVATIAALSQFINPSTESIGVDGITVAYNSILHSFNTIPTLVNMANGTSNTTYTLAAATTNSYAHNVTGFTTTATPDSTKLNTIADIISACVNQPTSSSGTGCSTLFANALPPAASVTSQPTVTPPTASDTIQAALYMFTNATDSNNLTARTALYNLAPAKSPYQPQLTAVPTDWTIAINYASSNTCGTGGASQFIAQPNDLQVDGSGDIWLANAQTSNSALSAVTANGAPLACVPLTGTSRGDVIDINGNIWFGDSTTTGAANLYRYAPASGTTLSFTPGCAPVALGADGLGNLFFSCISGTGSSATGTLNYIADGADATGSQGSATISTTIGPNPARIFPDKSNNLWITSGSSYVTEAYAAASAPAGSTYNNGFVSTEYSAPSPTSNVQTGSNNAVYVTSQDSGSTITSLIPSNGTYITQTGFPTAANTGGLNSPQGFWLDGAANSWAANTVAESATGLYSIAGVSATGTALTTTSATNGGDQKAATYLNKSAALVIDQSGNIWVSSTLNANSITEILGAAVPVYAPYAVGIKNGRFQSIP